MNSCQRLLKNAYLRIVRGKDFIDAMYEAKVVLKNFSAEDRKDNVLGEAFEALHNSLKVLTNRTDRPSLDEYIDSEVMCNKALFENAIKMAG